MSSKSMNISLSEPLYEFVGQRVADNAHGTVSSYIRSLIIEDKKRAAQEAFEQLVYEGLQSGEALSITETDLDDLRARVQKRVASLKST